MTARKLAGTETVVATEPAVDPGVLSDVDDVPLSQIVGVLEMRTHDLVQQVEKLYRGVNDPAEQGEGAAQELPPMRDRVGAVCNELADATARIEQYTERLGAPL